MAEELTAEELAAQQAAAEAEKRSYDEERETIRFQREMLKEDKRIKIEVVRLAKETLIENSRSKSVDERDVSADDITNFANVLYSYTVS